MYPRMLVFIVQYSPLSCPNSFSIFILQNWGFVLLVPPAFEIIMEDLEVCVSETLRFVVVVEGKPDPDILWYKVSFLSQVRFPSSIICCVS